MHDVLRRLHSNQIPYQMADPGDAGTIAPDRQLAVVEIVTSAAETRTLSDPQYAGQIMVLAMKTDGGDCTITADSAVDQVGNTSIVLGDAGDFIALWGIHDGSALEWRVVAQHGIATISLGGIQQSHVADPPGVSSVTFNSHGWDGATFPTQGEGDKIKADITALRLAVQNDQAVINAILAQLATLGLQASS